MKTVLLFMVTVVIVAESQGAVVTHSKVRSDLNIGFLGIRDRLLYRTYIYRLPIANSIQYEDFFYQGNATTRISAIQAIEQYPQYGAVWVTSGGLGWSMVNLRFMSYTGYGYNYIVQIWGQ